METGPAFWLIVLTLGVALLGGAMAFGIMRNRQRTPREKAITDIETKREFAREDRDAS